MENRCDTNETRPDEEEILKVLDEIVINFEQDGRQAGKRSSILKPSKTSEDGCLGVVHTRKSATIKRVSFADKFQVMELCTGNVYDVPGRNRSLSDSAVSKDLSFEKECENAERKESGNTSHPLKPEVQISSSSVIHQMSHENISRKHKMNSVQEFEPEKKKMYITPQLHSLPFNVKSRDSTSAGDGISEFNNLLNSSQDYRLTITDVKQDQDCETIQNVGGRDKTIKWSNIQSESDIPRNTFNMQNEKHVLFQSVNEQNSSSNCIIYDTCNTKYLSNKFHELYKIAPNDKNKHNLNFENLSLNDILMEKPWVQLHPVSLSSVPLEENKENLYFDPKNKNILFTNPRHLKLQIDDQPGTFPHETCLESKISDMQKCKTISSKSNIVNVLELQGSTVLQVESAESTTEHKEKFEETCLVAYPMDITCCSQQVDNFHDDCRSNMKNSIEEKNSLETESENECNGKYYLNNICLGDQPMDMTCTPSKISVLSSAVKLANRERLTFVNPTEVDIEENNSNSLNLCTKRYESPQNETKLNETKLCVVDMDLTIYRDSFLDDKDCIVNSDINEQNDDLDKKSKYLYHCLKQQSDFSSETSKKFSKVTDNKGFTPTKIPSRIECYNDPKQDSLPNELNCHTEQSTSLVLELDNSVFESNCDMESHINSKSVEKVCKDMLPSESAKNLLHRYDEMQFRPSLLNSNVTRRISQDSDIYRNDIKCSNITLETTNIKKTQQLPQDNFCEALRSKTSKTSYTFMFSENHNVEVMLSDLKKSDLDSRKQLLAKETCVNSSEDKRILVNQNLSEKNHSENSELSHVNAIASSQSNINLGKNTHHFTSDCMELTCKILLLGDTENDNSDNPKISENTQYFSSLGMELTCNTKNELGSSIINHKFDACDDFIHSSGKQLTQMQVKNENEINSNNCNKTANNSSCENNSSECSYHAIECAKPCDPGIVYAIKQIKAMKKVDINDHNIFKFPELFVSLKKQPKQKISYSCPKIHLSEELKNAVRKSCSFHCFEKELSFIAEINGTKSPQIDSTTDIMGSRSRTLNSLFHSEYPENNKCFIKNDTNVISQDIHPPLDDFSQEDMLQFVSSSVLENSFLQNDTNTVSSNIPAGFNTELLDGSPVKSTSENTQIDATIPMLIYKIPEQEKLLDEIHTKSTHITILGISQTEPSIESVCLNKSSTSNFIERNSTSKKEMNQHMLPNFDLPSNATCNFKNTTETKAASTFEPPINSISFDKSSISIFTEKNLTVEKEINQRMSLNSALPSHKACNFKSTSESKAPSAFELLTTSISVDKSSAPNFAEKHITLEKEMNLHLSPKSCYPSDKTCNSKSTAECKVASASENVQQNCTLFEIISPAKSIASHENVFSLNHSNLCPTTTKKKFNFEHEDNCIVYTEGAANTDLDKDTNMDAGIPVIDASDSERAAGFSEAAGYDDDIKFYLLHRKFIQASESEGCLWQLRDIDEKQAIFDLNRESMFACYRMYVPLDSENSETTSILFQHLKKKPHDIDELGLLLFKSQIPDNANLFPFCPDKLINQLSIYIDVALKAKLFIKDIWFISIRSKNEYSIDYSQDVPRLIVKIWIDEPFSLFSLTFTLNLKSYPHEKIFPEYQHLDFDQVNKDDVLECVNKIEPGKFYLRRMVEAVHKLFS